MAVFPDRIVLKNSTDDQATIEAAIQTGGTDEISQGEIVLGIENTDVKFYTKAGDGSIVTLGGTSTGATSLGELTDVDLSTPATDGQVIAYNSTSGNWEPVDQTGGGGSGIENVVEDTTPQLGGNLDTNTYYIISTSGNVALAPATGELVVRGGSSEGKITLNCTANTHGVSIQSPPHASAATYTLTLPDDTGTAGQVLSTDGSGILSWADGGGGSSNYTDPLTTDGDIVIRSGGVTTRLGIGSEGQVLTVSSGIPSWSAASGGGVEEAPEDGTPYARQDATWVPVPTGGGGSGAGIYLQESKTASGGAADFVGLGYSGILQKVTSSLNAWIALYTSAAARSADAGRAFDEDPAPGSGVLFEAYVTAGSTVIATPGTTYLNNDETLTEAIYAAIRDQSGAAVNATVTISAYGLAAITAVNGGTFGSGL